MVIYRKTAWIIMSKDRQYVAKGVPRSRYLIRVDDEKDKKRLITYNSKGMAENGFKSSGFYNQCDVTGPGYNHNLADYLEAVECTIEAREKE